MHHRVIYIATILLALTTGTWAQNMVPNGNFEAYTVCPTGVAQVSHCDGWRQYHGGTSDYYNTCANSASNVSIPINLFGRQHPASGNAYAGVQTYNGVSDYKEYIARPILPLTPGVIYEVSMSINLADSSGFATADLGVWFYDRGPTATVAGNNVLGVTPQISYSNYGAMADTAAWMHVVATFLADSAYDNIVIGGFGIKTPVLATSTGVAPYANYYIDSVVVKPTNLGYNLTDTALCTGDTLKLPFTAFTDRYAPTNTFSLQLSDVAGNFTNATIIASKPGNTGGVFLWKVPPNISPGNGYRLRIIASDQSDSSYISRPLTIGNNRPSKPFAWANVPVCEADSMKLNVTDATTGVVFRWSGPAGFWNSDQYPVRAPVLRSFAGQYIATAWLYGCSSSDTLPVNTIPTIGVIGIDGPGQACFNDTLKLTATSAAPSTTYKWTGPNGYLSYAKDTVFPHAYAALAGTYVLTGYYGGCSSNYNVGVSILPIPDSFFALHDFPVCDGDTLRFNTGSNSPGTFFRWNGPNGFSSTAKQPILKNANKSMNGQYIVTATLGLCSVQDTVIVDIVPKQNVMLSISNAPVCEGDTLKLYANTTVAGITGYTWTGPNGFYSSQKNPMLIHTTAASAGRYALTGNFAGCPSVDTLNVMVKPLPANLTITTNSPVCEGDTLIIDGSTSSQSALVHWNGPDRFSSSSPFLTFENAATTLSGDYTLTATLDGCYASDTTSIMIKPKPLIPQLACNSPLRVGDTLRLYVNNPETGVDYLWNGPSGFNSGIRDPQIDSVTEGNSGTYTIMANKDGCISGSLIIVTVNERPDTSFFNVYPNPNSGIFFIQATVNKDQAVPIHITASNGQEIYYTTVRTEKKRLLAKLNLKGAISSGLYTMRLYIDSRMYTVQLMIIDQ